MKPRRYHDDWPTADEARAWTERRRSEWERLSRHIAWFVLGLVALAFAAPYLKGMFQ